MSEDRVIRFIFLHPAPLGVDPLKALIGVNLAPILEPLLQPGRKASYSKGHRYWPLQLEENDGHNIPLGTYGSLGFINKSGYLCVVIPPAWREKFEQWVPAERRQGPAPGRIEASEALAYRIGLTADSEAVIEIPPFGNMGFRMDPEHPTGVRMLPLRRT